ncbi:MAG TPA: GAF domain-containing sensor histidine kinase [Terriglobales bacterium]|nr:GAF domain-containing sensor histidine kinase [Terriglobales bacterium]
MSACLVLKESSRALIQETVRALKPYFPEITAAWRARMFEEFQFDGRAMTALERLNLGTGFAIFCQCDFQAFAENLSYFGTRLAKLQVDAGAVARSLELYELFCEPYVAKAFKERRSEIVAALEMFSSAAFVAVSLAYFETQKGASSALLSVLDAELTAPDLSALLRKVLEITASTFGAQLGTILLREPEGDGLRLAAAVGFGSELEEDYSVRPGEGFSGKVAANGEPGLLVLESGESSEELSPILRRRAKSIWAVPLKKNSEEIIGVLEIGFAVPYRWMPTERELMRAMADRSALAIDRMQMTDALRERESRIAELSAHLLRVQEEERKHISRELHDETGQGLMVTRLYLGMLEASLRSRSSQVKIQEALAVVDRTIEGLRRMIARLSPLVLQELGLVAAMRKEAKDLSKSTGVKTRVAVPDDLGRLGPEAETAIYRVVQEALHNVAKHAQAKNVTVQIGREPGAVRLLVEDDGVGFAQKGVSRGRSFGLAGMRERIAALGGSVRVRSGKGRGTRIEVTVPEAAAVVQLPVTADAVYPARTVSAGSSLAS